MRRFQIPSAALAAGLAVFLSGCAGETPTSPSQNQNNSNPPGSCAVLVSLSAPTTSPAVGSAAVVRATVTRSGVPVADGGSVQFTTDAGVFLENGLHTISKTIVSGVADVNVQSLSPGAVHVKAVFDCGSAQITLSFGGTPETGPFVQSISPSTGSCAGGDTVTITGGRFGTSAAAISVTFGGVKAPIKGTVTETQFTVTTPAHPLTNPAVPETVNVVVTVSGAASPTFPFTFSCNPQAFVSSISPTEGSSLGGETVLINGGNFGANIATTRVTFCGRAATITAQVDTQISVLTPASPAALETCDVVLTRDLGLVSQQTATAPQQFTYRLVFTPAITSSSPKTGANDASTRVTVFGSGFQFPMQVFLTGGACGGQLVEAAVSDITLNTIVFKTPVAVGANVCLSSQLVDIVITNPQTGKTASCPACFKYYACPTITSAGPTFTNYNVTTQVVITGHNFEEPATVGGGGTVWQPISVSSQQIVAIAPLALLTGTCADISAPILVNGTSLSCPNAVGPVFTYWVKTVSPVVSSINPRELPEASVFPVLVTVTGQNFFAPNMRFVLNMPVGGPLTIFPESRTDTVMTFKAPALIGPYLTATCTTPAGETGKQKVPTSVELDVLNNTTTCFAKEQLVYVPTDQTCRVPITPPATLTIDTDTLPDGTVGTPYSTTLVALGGTPGYTWLITSGALPGGITLAAGTGVISGANPTTAGTFNFAMKVTDSVGATATKALSITINP